MNSTDQTVPVDLNAAEPLSTSQEKKAVGAFVGLNEARRLTGKSKETILKYANEGKLSTQLNAQGNKTYQVVDLGTVFGFVSTPTSQKTGQANQNEPVDKKGPTTLELIRLQGEKAVLEAQLAAERDKSRLLAEIAEKAEINADHWRVQAESIRLMLTHQPEAQEPEKQTTTPQPEPLPEPQKGFLSRLFGGR